MGRSICTNALMGVLIFVTVLAVIWVSSCNKASTPLGSGATLSGSDSARTASAASTDGFTFEPLDDDGSPDKRGPDAYLVKVKDKPDRVEVNISTKVPGDWKFVLGHLYYDADKYNPIDFEPGKIFGEDWDEQLTHPIFKIPGIVPFYFGYTNYDGKQGKPGGDIGTFIFEKEPWKPPRDPSDAPDDYMDKVFDLHEYEGSAYEHPNETGAAIDRFVVWGEVNRGDGNLDGEVTIADVAAVARHWNLTIDLWPMLDPVDYNDDGDINGADVMEISNVENYFENVDGYVIKLRATESGPVVHEITVPDPVSRANFVYYDDLTPDDPRDFYPQGHFWNWNGAVGYCVELVDAIVQEEIDEGTWYVSVTPYDDSGDGIESERVEMVFDAEPPDPTYPPVARLSVDKSQGYAPHLVTLSAAGSYDRDGGDIARYEWDIDYNGVEFLVDYDTGNVDNVSHTYTQQGEYQAVVRVTDDEGETDESNPADILVLEHLNEVGFTQEYADYDGVEDLQTQTMTKRFTLDFLFRDIEQELKSVDTVRLRFTGDLEGIEEESFDSYWWTDGLLAILEDQVEQGILDRVVNIPLYAPLEGYGIFEWGLNYAEITQQEPVLVPVGSSGLVGGVMFSVAPGFDGVIEVDFEFWKDPPPPYDWENSACYYTDDGRPPLKSLLKPYSNDPMPPVGYQTIICDGRQPLAVLTADPTSGGAPLIVYFDASKSVDTNGTIVKYEWDWDGEGSGPWDYDSGTDPTVQHMYSSPSFPDAYHAWVKVTDNDDATDTDDIWITVFQQ